MGGDHLDLRWIPPGAGTSVVRTSGRVYEAIVAAIERRRRAAIYHTALVGVAGGSATVARVLAELASVPRLVWGRDEWHLGDMWNCNSVIAWALTRAGVVEAAGAPPPGGRAPGWCAGVLAARR